MGNLKFWVGTDVGGTFTDVWVLASDGRSKVFKAPTTQDIISGVMETVKLASDAFEMDISEFCSRIERFGHGTTVGLNALLTGTAAKTAILTTAGFRDTLEIGRMKRMYAGLSELEVTDQFLRGRWPPLVDRKWIFEVPERIDFRGTVIQPLDEKVARKLVRAAARNSVEALAICTLWSTSNPDHERRLREIVQEEMPEAYVSVSHEMCPVLGEHARMSTTAVNTALGPVLSRYLLRLGATFGEFGLKCPILVMTGAGGVVAADSAAQLPASALFSGPTAGVVGCLAMAKQVGKDNALTIDVGGTSFDVGLIVEGGPLMRSESKIVGADILMPSVDVSSIGAGGGSIAKLRFGHLNVGPQSAGADPGPACYGRGGSEPTATDADVILGTLDPETFLGGRMRLDPDAASRAINDKIAKPLGLSLVEAAWGIRRVFESRMADLLRRVTIERGHDPREFIMFATGGAGPAHAWALCGEIGVADFIVPATATAQSAFGTGMCDLRHTAQRPIHVRIRPDSAPSSEQYAELKSALEGTEKDVADALSRDMIPYKGMQVERSVGLRYLGQTHQLDVPFPETEVTEASFAACLERFERLYESMFGRGSGFRQAGFEMSYVRAVGTGVLETPATRAIGEPLKPVGSRSVVFDDPRQPVEASIFIVEYPALGQRVEGPCIIEFPGHTVVVPPGASVDSDEFANLHVRINS